MKSMAWGRYPIGVAVSVAVLATFLFRPAYATQASARDQSSGSDVYVTVISCAKDISIAPTVSIDGWPVPGKTAGKSIIAVAVAEKADVGIYHATIRVGSGNYTVIATSTNCRTPGPRSLSIFSPEERHVTLLTSVKCCAVPTLYDSAVAVSLPDNLSVHLLPVSTWNGPSYRIGTRDGSLLYFDSLASDKYVLEISVNDAVACESFTIPATVRGYQKLIRLRMREIAPLLRVSAEAQTHTCH
jgi:hypothetical protein